MSKPIISKKTLNEFREYLTNWILREIQMEFDAAEIRCDTEYNPPVSGERRYLVEQFYHSLDLTKWEDTRKLLRVFENVLITLDTEAQNPANHLREDAKKNLANLRMWLGKDGFMFQNGQIVSSANLPALPQVKSFAVEFNAPYLAQQIKRLEDSVEADPWLAIGTAKELVETTCKTILSDLGKPVDPKWDLMDLFKATRSELQLAPDNIPDSAKAAETIKRILSNLGTLIQGLAELRNPYGTGHGPTGKAKGLQPRHARLAVGAATTLATFLFETYRTYRQRQENPV